MLRSRPTSQRGQAMVLFTLALTAIVLGVAVVVDGGYAYAQRRNSQNAADFAAMAGARIIGVSLVGDQPLVGTAANVENSIESVLLANGAQLEAAEYVDRSGNALGNVVGSSTIPSSAFGVVVDASTRWKPFLLSIIGINDWAATSSATAVTEGESLGGGVLPIGIQDTMFDSLELCAVTDLDGCVNNLTTGQLNIPGGFGWLKFGLGPKCDWTSLGMIDDGGCQTSKPFLDSQIGPPADTHGCCTAAGVSGEDRIGSLTGNEWGDLSYYVDNQIPVWVPIWDTAHGTGSNAYYHIVGFGPLLLTGDNEHAKWLEGAVVDADCKITDPVSGAALHKYCQAPGGAFTIDITGEVQLVR